MVMKKILFALVFFPVYLIAGSAGFIPLSEMKLKNSLYMDDFLELNKNNDFGIFPENKLIELIDDLIFLTQDLVEMNANEIFDLREEVRKLDGAKNNLYSVTSTVDLCTVSSILSNFANSKNDPNEDRIFIINTQLMEHAENISKFQDGMMFKFTNQYK